MPRKIRSLRHTVRGMGRARRRGNTAHRRYNLFHQVRAGRFRRPYRSNSTGKNMTTLTASQVFTQLAQLAGQDVLQNALPVITSTLADIEANPQTWVNPASAILKGNAFLTSLLATLPTIEGTAVTGAAQLVGALITSLNAKLVAASGTTTPAAVGSEIATAVTTAA